MKVPPAVPSALVATSLSLNHQPPCSAQKTATLDLISWLWTSPHRQPSGHRLSPLATSFRPSAAPVPTSTAPHRDATAASVAQPHHGIHQPSQRPVWPSNIPWPGAFRVTQSMPYPGCHLKAPFPLSLTALVTLPPHPCQAASQPHRAPLQIQVAPTGLGRAPASAWCVLKAKSLLLWCPVATTSSVWSVPCGSVAKPSRSALPVTRQPHRPSTFSHSS